MRGFFRFPHTPHLAWLGNVPPRDGKVLTALEARDLLTTDIIVEEKLDGANLGISIGNDGNLQFQNRGEYLLPPFTGQFARLNGWAEHHRFDLMQELGPDLMLFGEWCAARHSVAYDALPDWFVAFDVFDRAAERFWSVPRRDMLAKQIAIPTVPCLSSGRTTLDTLITLTTTRNSQFGQVPLEGLMVRRDGTEWIERRAKLVRPDFLQAIGEHWRRRQIEWNKVNYA